MWVRYWVARCLLRVPLRLGVVDDWWAGGGAYGGLQCDV